MVRDRFALTVGWSGARSILFQRGIYPPETFERKKKYGLTMLVSSDAGLTEYLNNVLKQISGEHPALSLPASAVHPASKMPAGLEG